MNKKLYVLMLCLFSVSIIAKLTGSLTEEAITERFKPEGNVEVSGAAVVSESKAQDPAKIYKKFCSVCHESGFAGAPRYKNKGDWQARAAKGLDTLTEDAFHGIRSMPAKGNCQSCSKEEIRDVVNFMLDAIK